MLKVLLKKQFSEIFRSYFYDPKKNKKRSRGATIAYIVLFVLLMVGMLGGIFTGLSVALCPPMAGVGMGWLFFLLMGLLSLMLGVFGSVFNTYSSLYLAKDNDLLLSMPIPTRYIMATRLVTVYLMGLMYSGVVIIPAVIVYLVMVSFSVMELLGGLALILSVSLLVFVLSCLLGWVVAKVSMKMKNKSMITVLISLLFFAAYYAVCMQADSLINTLISNAAFIGLGIRTNIYPLYLFGSMGEGNGMGILICLAVIVALTAGIMLLISRSFLKIVTTPAATAHREYKEKTAKAHSPFSALLISELRRFSSNASYMLNCGLGVLFLVVMGVVMLVMGNKIVPVMGELLASQKDSLLLIFYGVVCMVISMANMAVPSVSLDGKMIWIAQSMPVRMSTVLHAKLSVELLLTSIPALFCAVCMVIVLPCSLLEAILLIAAVLLFSLLSSCFDLFLGLKMPNLHWSSEMAVIKQSANVAISIFGGWFFGLAAGALYVLLCWPIGAVAYLAILCALSAGLSALLLRWISTKGAKIYLDL